MEAVFKADAPVVATQDLNFTREKLAPNFTLSESSYYDRSICGFPSPQSTQSVYR